MTFDPVEIERDFRAAVNVDADTLERWLETPESHSVGQKDDGGESIGHRSGRRIVTILSKREGELTDADLEHMRKVVGYVRRHLAQRPQGDVTNTRWRWSLLNWGHDPLASRRE